MGYATSFQQSLQRGRRTMMKKGYAKGGMKKKGYAMGGMKAPTVDQKGLKKLPKPVRNKMGYMSKGGMAKKGYAKGGMQMKKKGYARGGFLAGPAKPMKGIK